MQDNSGRIPTQTGAILLPQGKSEPTRRRRRCDTEGKTMPADLGKGALEMKPSLVSLKPGGSSALSLFFGVMIILAASGVSAAGKTSGTWPQGYEFRTDPVARSEILSTPYYRVVHDLNRGGVISHISYTYGRSKNLLKTPLACGVDVAGDKPGSF